MNQTPHRTTSEGPEPDGGPATVYPIQSFLEIQRLMKRLGLTPADCLQLLAEVLSDLDRQIEEEADGLPFPLAFLDERP